MLLNTSAYLETEFAADMHLAEGQVCEKSGNGGRKVSSMPNRN